MIRRRHTKESAVEIRTADILLPMAYRTYLIFMTLRAASLRHLAPHARNVILVAIDQTVTTSEYVQHWCMLDPMSHFVSLSETVFLPVCSPLPCVVGIRQCAA